MQRKKILIACLSVLLVLALPAASIPRAHAFVNTPIVTLAGLGVSGFNDPLLAPCPLGSTCAGFTGIAAGAVLNVNVYLVASTAVYQRNVTVGFKGDWMNTYQNATTASSTATLPLTAGQTATVTIAVTMPSSGAISPHGWTVAVWNGATNSRSASSCNANNFGQDPPPAPAGNSCGTLSNSNAGYSPLAIYTSDQLGAAQANVQAKNTVISVGGALGLLSSHPNTPGITAASGQLAQASTELTLGNQAWQNGDYSGARGHYQSALNDANAASGSLTNQGGGVDNATLVNLILGSTGIALIGIGALFAGLGTFFYWRRKPKA